MPGWIPGNVDLGDPLVAFQAIHSSIGKHGTEQDGELLVRFARFTPFAFEHGHHSGLRRHDDIARRVLAETGAAVPAVLKLRLARNELPNTNELAPSSATAVWVPTSKEKNSVIHFNMHPSIRRTAL